MIERASAVGVSYENTQGLLGGLWSDIAGRRIVLITNSSDELGLRHGLATVLVARFLAGSDTSIVSLRDSDRSTVGLRDAVVLLGDVEGFTNPVVRGLLSRIDYHPYSMPEAGSEDSASDETAGSQRPPPDNLGFIYRASVRNVSTLPVLVVSGNSPNGVLAAAAWATEGVGRSGINAPCEFPSRPIEAVVYPLAEACPGGALDASPFVMTYKLKCGRDHYDFASEKWVTENSVVVGLISDEKGNPQKIQIGRSYLTAKPVTDTFKLIWFLAEKATWCSLADAVRGIDGDGAEQQGRVQTLTTRLSEIRAAQPYLVLSKEGGKHKLFRINARSIVKKRLPSNPKA